MRTRTRNVLPGIELYELRTGRWLEELRDLRRKKKVRKKTSKKRAKRKPFVSVETQKKLDLLTPEMRKLLGL